MEIATQHRTLRNRLLTEKAPIFLLDSGCRQSYHPPPSSAFVFFATLFDQ